MSGYSIFTRSLMLSVAVLMTACGRSKPIATAATTETIRNQIQSDEARLTLVHVWATWCGPCREEFPELMKVQQHYADADIRIMLISADDPKQPEVVEAFLAEYGSAVGSLIATELNEAFIETISPQWSGALPATYFYTGDRLLTGWEGKHSYGKYVETIDNLLNL